MSELLRVENLHVTYDGEAQALRGVDITLERGESLAVVGESGSGKSTLAMALAGLHQPPRASGSVRIDGQELIGASQDVLRELRWERVALCLQSAPFSPVTTVGAQVAEPLCQRRGLSAAAGLRRAEEVAAEMLLDPELLHRFPHQLSGGQRRRAYLAMAMVVDPDLLVLDEPTAGLDMTTQRELVARIAALAAERGFGLVVVSHDLPDATALAERTMVLYAGEAMELGATERVIDQPAHPYTWGLINVYPVMNTTKDLRAIRGRGTDPRAVPPGCPFHPRCTQAESICWEQHPPLELSRGRRVSCHFGGLKTLLSATGVYKTYADGQRQVRAVQNVSLTLQESQSIGVIGPSGSGKSTLAQIITGHLRADAGTVELGGKPVSTSWNKDARRVRQQVQLIMQDPWDALSPRLTVADLVAEPLRFVTDAGDHGDHSAAVAAMLDAVGLPTTPGFLGSRTHELSGGQLQRIAIARALVISPKVLVADEPTALLDASEQARLLAVLRERQVEMGLGLILISHDLAVVRKVVDHLIILDEGRVVEEGPSSVVSTAPTSRTGRALIDSAPAFSVGVTKRLTSPVREQLEKA